MLVLGIVHCLLLMYILKFSLEMLELDFAIINQLLSSII